MAGTRLLTACLLLLGAAAPAADRPNVLVIVADDLGYADLGFQGCKDIPTPRLDALAASGVRCTDGYATCPVCSPTRAGLLTGRYQQRFGYEFLGGGLKPMEIGLPPGERTVAELLRAAGYATGAIGKWHLGKEPKYQPWNRGFDEFYGFLGGGRSYFPTAGRPPVAFAPLDPLVRQGGEAAEDPPYLTDAFGREAAAFIDRHAGKPWFLYLAFNAVHVPLQAPEDRLARFAGISHNGRRTYAAMLSAMDDAVGVVTQTLREKGVEKETLVVFVSDNGGHPLANAARNDPLRGQKGETYEGGIRVPFVVSWPGRLPAGKVYGEPVTTLDVLPTALAAAGVTPPADLRLDGVDLLPYLAGERKDAPHEALYWKYGDHHAVRRGRWKLTVPANGEPGLYDLAADIGESNDLSATEPGIRQELERLSAAWEAELPPPAWGPGILERSARRAASGGAGATPKAP